MFPSHVLMAATRSNRAVYVDESRPTRNKAPKPPRSVDTKPRLFVPHHHKNKSPKMRTKVQSSDNALAWMQSECPLDVLPKIIAYTGPQMAWNLNLTNKFWHSFFHKESTWRTMCEELYKWKEGEPQPTSWKLLYRYSPCVPIDYPSIRGALSVASDHNEHIIHDAANINPCVMEQRRNIRILLRPGEYFMKEAIVIQAVGERTTVSIETMEMPQFDPILKNETDEDAPPTAFADRNSPSPAKRMLQRASSMASRLSCRSSSMVQDEILLSSDEESESKSGRVPLRAVLISKSRRQNEPLLRVRQGTLRMDNIGLVHYSNGIDIWNGNAAIQIQPAMGSDDRPVATRPIAHLHRVDVTSRSGRGIVNMDGGVCTIRRCYVHDCAATGIYVGGPGSRAVIELTDVTQNGNGNRTRRGGIAPGHSGIYLEQGRAVVRDCNISQNSLTGISAISQDNAILSLEQSDLVANGAVQLEMPPNGSLSHRRSLTRDNNFAINGYTRSRSGLIED